MNKIELPVHGIVVTIETGLEGTGGSITCSPDLYEVCPKCNCRECLYSCDESQSSSFDTEDGRDVNFESEETVSSRHQYNGAIDGITGMILAHACAGIDIETPAYLEGIETAINGAAENI